MLQLRSWDRPRNELYGGWSRQQLLEMNDRYVAAVEAAFQAGLESPASAKATFQAKSRRVGRGEVIEAALSAAWSWFWRDMDSDVPFSAVVAFVRARCPGVDPARVRAGFDRRFARRSVRLM